MIRVVCIALLSVCALAIGALLVMDYTEQRNAAASPDTFGVTQYIASVKARAEGTVTQTDRFAVYMPSPEGWTSRPMTDADRDKLLSGLESTEAYLETYERILGDTPIVEMTKALAPRGQGSVTVFQKGQALVAIEWKPIPPAVFQGIDDLMIDYLLSASVHSEMARNLEFAKVDGLSFHASPPGPSAGREFGAVLGREFGISIYAQATAKDIYDVVSGIDIAAVNRTLTHPMHGVDEGASTAFVFNPRATASVPSQDELLSKLELQAEMAGLTPEPTADNGGGVAGLFKSIFSGSEAKEETKTAVTSCAIVGGAKRCTISYE